VSTARRPSGDAVAAMFADGLLAEVASGRARLLVSYRTGEELVIIAAGELAALEANASSSGGQPGPSPLTARETAVLRLVGDGASGAQIADRLGLALNTVNQHLVGARRKLGVHSSKEAAARSQARGWLHADGDALGA